MTTLGEDIIAVMGNVQTVSLEIDGALRVLLADHVHVALDDNGLVVLIALGGRSEEDDVVQLVLDIADALLFGKGDQIIGDDLGVAGAVGHGAQLLEIAEDGCGLQARQTKGLHLTHPARCG